MRKLLFITFLISIYANAASLPEDLKTYPKPYQDIIINNEVVQTGHRSNEGENRYQVIKELLDNYERPFTVLEIGASEGYFSLRIANDYDAVCVMVEDGCKGERNSVSGERLTKICKHNTNLNNIIHLRKCLDPYSINRNLSHNQHFDVVIVLNVLHHMDWRASIDAICNLGDYVLIENPDDPVANKSLQEIREYLYQKGEILACFDRSHSSKEGVGELFLIQGKQRSIESARSDLSYPITSTFKEKYFVKDGKRIDWTPGISLHVYLMLQGRYPLRSTLFQQLQSFRDDANFYHNDIAPWNCLITTNGIQWIDFLDPDHDKDQQSKSHHTMKCLDCYTFDDYFSYLKTRLEPLPYPENMEFLPD